MTSIYGRYGVFSLTDGSIDRVVDCLTFDLPANILPGEDAALFEGEQMLQYRDLENDVWVNKNPPPLTISTTTPAVGEEITIYGIPAPCQLRVDGILHDIVSQELDLTFQNAGIHIILLQLAEYEHQEIILNVSA